ncbi:HNH endonuclease [Microbacterium sp. IEGM 1404]|uniref:HNH endonuclease n=1 Tax=Microbacterium sp. IEGM 1404 TaxID=3047084 RepID=UPI0024B77917|nr:HNH endonuclease signature motif containing protein [Microbacterium sp. IEGM 1404]MDI9889943.1 HNH endonuclease signature motif containing protein [Microbacterium sp. IEGM 1404]
MSPRDPMAEARPIVHKRSGGMCERCCARRATDVHHRQLRRHGDHKPANLVDLCRECHNRVHEHRDEATAAGFIVSGRVDPRTVPVQHGLYGRVLLDDAGGWGLAA